jgi:putative addiction module component (TIGR02574 family)
VERRSAVTRAEQSVLDEALSLPVEGRVALVEKLLVSLNLPTDREVEEWWAEEAERRVSQLDRGEVELAPGEEVFRRIREKHRR